MLYIRDDEVNTKYHPLGLNINGQIYKPVDNFWCQYLAPASERELIDTLEFQLRALDTVPVTKTLPTVDLTARNNIELKEDVPKVPADQILKLMKIFIHYADRHLEAGARLLYNSETEDYQFVIPKHTALSGVVSAYGSLTEEWDFSTLDGIKTSLTKMISSGYQEVGRFHSHHSMAPNPSGQDNKDEIGEDKAVQLCCITGNIKKTLDNVYYWENKLNIATPWGRVFVEEADYFEPYDPYEIANVYPNGIPALILMYLNAGISPKPVSATLPQWDYGFINDFGLKKPGFHIKTRTRTRISKGKRLENHPTLNLALSVIEDSLDSLDLATAIELKNRLYQIIETVNPQEF